MPALDLQAAIARLYVDRAARESLMRGEFIPGAFDSLTNAEKEDLAKFARRYVTELEDFASTLDRKRQRRLSTCYPMTRAVVREQEWSDALAYFCAICAPRLLTEDLDDAIALGEFLINSVAASTVHFSHQIRDLVTLECAIAKSQRSHRLPESGLPKFMLRPEMRVRLLPSVTICRLLHEPKSLLQWAEGHKATLPPSNGDSIYVLVLPNKPGGRTRRIANVGSLLGSVLERADGQASVLDIVSDSQNGNPVSQYLPTLLDNLMKLAQVGVLTYE